MLRKALALVPLALAGVLATSGGEAVSGERVRIALGGFGNMHYLPYDVAQALGYFTEQGLDVEFEYVKSGTQAASALLAGGVDFSGNSFDHAIKASLRGRRLVMIAAFTEVPGQQIVVRSDERDAVRELRDLKSRPVGVTGLGANSHLTLTYVLTRAGVDVGDVDAVPVGFDTMGAALENGRIVGAVTVGLQGERLVDAGKAFVLLDLTSRREAERLFGGPVLNTGVLTRPEICAERVHTCGKLVRAIVRANRWIATHTPEEIAAALPDAIVQDRRLYAKALSAAHDGYSKDGRIDPRAVETAIAAHRAFGVVPADARVDAGSLYDNRFVDRALAGGS